MGDSPDLCQREILQILLGLSTAPLSEWTSCPWWCSKVQRGKRWSNTQRGKRSSSDSEGFLNEMLHIVTWFYHILPSMEVLLPEQKNLVAQLSLSVWGSTFQAWGAVRGNKLAVNGILGNLELLWSCQFSNLMDGVWLLLVQQPFGPSLSVLDRSTSFCHSSNYPIFYPHVYDAYHLLNGRFRNLNWRYLPYIRPIFQAWISGNIPTYPQKIWPYMVLTYLSTSILGSWNYHWPSGSTKLTSFSAFRSRSPHIDPMSKTVGASQVSMSFSRFASVASIANGSILWGFLKMSDP